MSHNTSNPQTSAADRADRARHIFTQLLAGRTMREIADAEGLSVRRVQQIVAHELTLRDCNPAGQYALLQIARLERALELLGRQIDEGKAAAVPAFVRVAEQLGRLAKSPLCLKEYAYRTAHNIGEMEERFERLAAAREVLAERSAATEQNAAEKSTKEKPAQAIENTQNREMADYVAQ